MSVRLILLSVVVCFTVWSKKGVSPWDRYSQHATRESARLLETSHAFLSHTKVVFISRLKQSATDIMSLRLILDGPLIKIDRDVKTVFGTASEVVANGHRLSSIRLRGTPSHLICLAELL